MPSRRTRNVSLFTCGSCGVCIAHTHTHTHTTTVALLKRISRWAARHPHICTPSLFCGAQKRSLSPPHGPHQPITSRCPHPPFAACRHSTGCACPYRHPPMLRAASASSSGAGREHLPPTSRGLCVCVCVCVCVGIVVVGS